MADQPNLEIPPAVRELAERNVEQTRAAYTQFLEMARQAQTMMAQSSVVVTESAKTVQSKAMSYAQDNVESSFSFAGELAKARDLKEFLEIQMRYTQRQTQAYAQQAQEIGRLMAEAAQKAAVKR